MSPPLLGVEEEGQSSVSSPPVDCLPPNGLEIKEWNYHGLSVFSSVDSSSVTGLSEYNKNNLNLKATELRLGLPGSQSPERKTELCLLNSGKLDEKTLFPLLPSKDRICSSSQKCVAAGHKRGFSDTMDGLSEVKGTMYTEKNWMFHGAGLDSQSPQPLSHGKYSVPQASVKKDVPANAIQERPCATNKTNLNRTGVSNNSSSAPAAK
ncbi:Auxin-responsive protein IAA9 [Hibiscus syriacus]|uniref:Auxin-responsive protein IAA9 n=2 Tax=Hibiscus syriacus TaxID=106335 RepID=A0A6A2ZXT9_HIBSY|nr:Auxin-responsive protein IAA9 [Hibiscus syriacus]